MKTIAALVALISLVPAAPAAADPVQWNGNGHWYEVFLVTDGITWEAARDAAVSQGGYLATLTSEEENTFVYGLVTDEQYWINTGNGEGPWLGGHQPAGSGEPGDGWAWVTGEPWDYTNWAADQPDDGDGAENSLEFFVYGESGTGSAWNDYKNDATFFEQPLPVAYIVEFTPEPGSLSLLAAGAVGLFIARRRRAF